MSQGSQRDEQRKRRRPWSKTDDEELARLIDSREAPGAIARKLGRTVDGVRGRAAFLHLVLPSPLRPWRQHAKPWSTEAAPSSDTNGNHDEGDTS